MEWWVYWLAAAPVAATVIMLTPHPGVSGRERWVSPWVGLVAFLFLSTGFLTQCSLKSGAVADIERQLFDGEDRMIAVYDDDEGRLLQFTAEAAAELPSRDLGVLAQRATPTARGWSGPGSASLGDYRPVRTVLEGTPGERARMAVALARLVGTEHGAKALEEVLRRDDVVISFSDEIGLDMPTGQTLSTGGSAVTIGTHIYLSRLHYGESSTAVLAAMAAHELTHVAQNLAAGSKWWQWPWTTVNREETAHMMQAIVWAELRGSEREKGQDEILEHALSDDSLRNYITLNPAYPWWLSPDIAC